MRLTAELAARVAAAAGPQKAGPLQAAATPATREDHDRMMAEILAGAGPDGNVWVFAYGSLIWKPAFEFVDMRQARVEGLGRRFSLGWDNWFRGSVERPGVMLVLDEGDACDGVAYRLPPDAVEPNLLSLLEREVRLMPDPFPPRWIDLATEEGPIRAVTFVVDRDGIGYVGGLSMEETADVLATAVGEIGSMAEYLHNTVADLDRLGIRDAYLWRLQEMVAERIEAAHPASAGEGTASPATDR